MQSFLTSLTGQVQPRVITNLGPRSEPSGLATSAPPVTR
jgi:hypothetical protein